MAAGPGPADGVNADPREQLLARLQRVLEERHRCGDGIRYDELTQMIDDLLDRMNAMRVTA